MLTIHQLECRRGASLLITNFNMSLDVGELIHLQGANGAGKTSLLRIISGYQAKSQVRFCGMALISKPRGRTMHQI